jgi:hypothetical protein
MNAVETVGKHLEDGQAMPKGNVMFQTNIGYTG